MGGMTDPLVEEAMRKAAVAWIAVDDGPARLRWCLAAEGSLWVISGPGEQTAPELATAERARVTLRGDHGGRIVTWPAVVTRVVPGSEEWDEVVPQLAGKRLNAPAPAEAMVARWAAECAVHKLTPAGEPVEAGPTLPDASLAEPPRETPARRRTRTPFHLHRVRRRRPGA
jgi:hypothetical protein